MLKAWMRKHFTWLRHAFEGDFKSFLEYSIEHSGCDKKAVEHFRHSADGYKFEGDYEAFQRELEVWRDDAIE